MIRIRTFLVACLVAAAAAGATSATALADEHLRQVWWGSLAVDLAQPRWHR